MEQHNAEMDLLEQQWPKFTEKDDIRQKRSADSQSRKSDLGVPHGLSATQELDPKAKDRSASHGLSAPQELDPKAQNRIEWGDVKLGRIPKFVRMDTRAKLGLQRGHASLKILRADAAEYKAKYDTALQYFQTRCQHHIHPLRAVKRPGTFEADAAKRRKTETAAMVRVVPNACRAKGKTNECKHEAPWTAKLNHGPDAKPRLICPGTATKRELRRSGARNAIG